MDESSKSDEDIDVYALGEEKIATGKELLAKLDTFKRIDGVAKIQRKISSEISSLQKVNEGIWIAFLFDFKFNHRFWLSNGRWWQCINWKLITFYAVI